MRALLTASLGVLLGLAGCAVPPPSAYVKSFAAQKPAAQTAIGKNAVGEACTLEPIDSGADIFCGTWQQPSARVRAGEAVAAGDLARIATASPWRAGIDQRYECQAPAATTILDGHPAELLQCTQRRGGWPHVALVALVGGHVWYADGVLPAAPVMQRAIGVRAGLISADAAPPSSAADALLATRLAAQSVRSGDIGQFDTLMAAGTRANLADNPAAAEAAFRAALALQQKALGRDNPNTATAMMTLALQLSDEGRYAEAASLFTRAGRLAPSSADALAPSRLLHYRALDALNQGHAEAALALLKQAEAGYAALLPPSALTAHRRSAARLSGPGATLIPDQDLLADPAGQAALLGLIETRRNEALVLRELGRLDESRTMLASASDLAEANGLARPILAARLYRTSGVTAAAAGDASLALADLAQSTAAFGRALPDSKPLADTYLLRASELARAGRAAEALPLCRSAVAALIALKAGTTPTLMEPCLAAYGTAADATTETHAKQVLLAEMFGAAELAQGGITSQQIAQATARLQENARDPRVAEAIRRREDASAKLQSLYRARDELTAAAQAGGNGAGAGAGTSAMDAQIKEAQSDLADADAALQAASPNFGQLAQQVVPAAAVLAALHPHEALAAIMLGPHSGWVFLLRDGQITVHKADLDLAGATVLVKKLRAGIEPTEALPAFDVAAARALYDRTLGTVAPALDGVQALVVAPSGPLLAFPFEVLLTGPADDAHLADAPWLLRRFTITHVPAPSNFVSLRKIAGGSRATKPWFGFGDFIPIKLAQAERSFPGATCAESAQLLAGLPQLPGARRELDAARGLLGAGPNDELLGAAFTVPSVEAAKLKNVRILHFAAHALLPAELRCQSEPAIITSTPPGAVDASGALLTASDVTGLDLDAELVILSACNSGGPGGGVAGESLSGLARAFFFAGARALLVTHWSVNDQIAAYLVADSLRRLHETPAAGIAGALRDAELGLLAQAGHGLPAEVAHPFFWAPFAVIGEGGAAAAGAKVAARVSPGARAGL
jgi:CHAT domain-containing protein